jgi:hypothetical protein
VALAEDSCTLRACQVHRVEQDPKQGHVPFQVDFTLPPPEIKFHHRFHPLSVDGK